MRAFLAIDLPENIRDTLAGIQGELKKGAADVKWVSPGNIHLTLKFLGEINDNQAEKIKAILAETAQHHQAFYIKINSLGAFPKLDYPRVIWAGALEGKAETEAIAAELEEKIIQMGIPKEEKPFACHITLGRVRSSLNKERLVKAILGLNDSLKKETMEFPAFKITFYKSTLTPNGPLYQILNEAVLKTN
ncbi:MAG TPA: RNA 2',3'-cyclic phosphodiesterase [Candidatus Margulisiibacteriota bacterium]|nr:RNA 2',3'-cyclic phosphodiesterase [Candidatus Margulisiibacteriota bacterium]